MAQETYTVGSQVKFVLSPTITDDNGTHPWVLAGGTVTLYVLNVDTAVTTTYAGVVSGDGSSASYVWTVPSAGRWRRSWKVVDAQGVTEISLPVPFVTVASP